MKHFTEVEKSIIKQTLVYCWDNAFTPEHTQRLLQHRGINLSIKLIKRYQEQIVDAIRQLELR